MVSYKDTENLVPSKVKVSSAPRFHASRVRKVCCTQSKAISKSAILLVGVAFVVVGVSLAWTVTPLTAVDCDTGTNTTNCSIVCQSSLPLPTPTRTRGEGGTTPPFAITPSPTSSPGGGTSRTEREGDGVTSSSMIITPSPLYVTTPFLFTQTINETSCDCQE